MTAGLSARQRHHVVDTIRRELELYGGLPPLYRRHLARTVDRMAELYGIEPKEVRALWKDYLARRRADNARWQRERFLARVARGECGTVGTLTLAQLDAKYGPQERQRERVDAAR